MPFHPCHVTQGFREDCSKLISRFEKLETVRYDGFCEIWQDMKFSLVFTGRKSFIELLEFCEDSLVVAKEFFLPPLSFKERIGGLYLLYGLYFKMPVDGPKIRVRLTEWRDIIELRAEIGQAEHHDASFILSKLMSANAFVHCILDQELGLEKNYRSKAGHRVNPYSLLPEIRELAVPNDLFDRIGTLSKQYESAKSSATTSGSSDTSGSTDLRLYDSDFGAKLLSAVEQLENARKVNGGGSICETITNRHEKMSTFKETKNEIRKTGKTVKDVIRGITGRGFDTDSSEEEELQPPIQSGNNQSLPDFFDDSSFSE